MKGFRYAVSLILYLNIHVSCWASPVVGQDTLAAQHEKFNVVLAARYFKRGTALGVLDTTFGRNLDSLNYLLTFTYPAYFRFHIINGSCIRGHRCGRHELGHGRSSAGFERSIIKKDQRIRKWLQERTLEYRNLCSTLPWVKCLGSPILEHNLSCEAYTQLAVWMKHAWPSLQLVNSYEGNGCQKRVLGSWLESHGVNAREDAEIVSLDGHDALRVDTVEWLRKVRKSKIAFLHTASYNCKKTGVWQDPLKRTKCPTGWQLQKMNQLAYKKK